MKQGPDGVFVFAKTTLYFDL